MTDRQVNRLLRAVTWVVLSIVYWLVVSVLLVGSLIGNCGSDPVEYAACAVAKGHRADTVCLLAIVAYLIALVVEWRWPARGLIGIALFMIAGLLLV